MDQPAAALSPSSSNEDIADLSLSDVEPLSWSGVEEVSDADDSASAADSVTPDEDVASLTPSDEQQMTASYSDRALDHEESQRDRTALYSLDEIEKAATANEEALLKAVMPGRSRQVSPATASSTTARLVKMNDPMHLSP